MAAPLPLMAQIAAIAHHHGGIARERQRDLVGTSGAHDEPDAAPAQAVLDLGEALQHEGEMARIGVRKGGQQAETHDHAAVGLVCPPDRILERRVELGALRCLHPVEDIAPVACGRSLSCRIRARCMPVPKVPLLAAATKGPRAKASSASRGPLHSNAMTSQGAPSERPSLLRGSGMRADVGGLQFRPRLWPSLAALAALIVLVSLGTWQVERLRWKEALVAERDARLAAPAGAAAGAGRLAGVGVSPRRGARHLPARPGAAVRRQHPRRPAGPPRADPAAAPRRHGAAGRSRLGPGRQGAPGRAPRGPGRGAGHDHRHRPLPRRGCGQLVHAGQPARADDVVQLRPAGARAGDWA